MGPNPQIFDKIGEKEFGNTKTEANIESLRL